MHRYAAGDTLQDTHGQDAAHEAAAQPREEAPLVLEGGGLAEEDEEDGEAEPEA